MSNTAIKVENLSKRYRIGLKEEIHDTMVEAVTDFVKRPIKKLQRLRKLSTFSKNGNESEDIIWALKDVSFEVGHGEVVGIIGRNGAGKSTLLKIISRITEPTSGSVTFNGRVSSLLEVGTGFHAELTGRENVYLNGTILGMSKTEIDRKFDEIVAFSEVEKFLDTPVKRYSSGMKVRLAFAVAAHLEPEILLVDEVLAVGDAEFQKKCLGKMGSIAGEGRTILFVSHNLTMLQRLCPEAMLLESGCFIDRGESSAIVQKYLGLGTSDVGERSWTWSEEQKRSLEPFIPHSIRVKDHNDNISERINSYHSFNIEMEYEITRSVSNLKIGVTLSTGTGERFCVCWDNNTNQRTPGIYLSRCEIPANLFSHGGFILGLITGIPGAQKLFRDFELLTFYIDSDTEISRMGRSILRPEFKWDTELIQK